LAQAINSTLFLDSSSQVWRFLDMAPHSRDTKSVRLTPLEVRSPVVI
jgi:hypothetical protein